MENLDKPPARPGLQPTVSLSSSHIDDVIVLKVIDLKPDICDGSADVLFFQMDPSDTDFDPDPERETNSDGESDRVKEEAAVDVKPESQLDFYQADPFTQGDRMYRKSSLDQ